MAFFHFNLNNIDKPEEIIIILENPILIDDELEEHIRKALDDGTFDRTTFIVPGVIDIKGNVKKFISDEQLELTIKSIVARIKGDEY